MNPNMARQDAKKFAKVKIWEATLGRVDDMELTDSAQNSKIYWEINPATRTYFTDIVKVVFWLF